jgi:hypothetical protein
MGILILDLILGLIRDLIRDLIQDFVEGIVDEGDIVDGDGEEEDTKLDSFMQPVRLQKVLLCQEHHLRRKR